jgi:CHAT domain-containing protein/Tfp pilus assembly protein PilF
MLSFKLSTVVNLAVALTFNTATQLSSVKPVKAENKTLITQSNHTPEKIYQLGLELLGKSDLAGALAKFEQSLTIFRSKKEAANIAVVLIKICDCYRNLGQLERAKTNCSESLKIAKEINDQDIVAGGLNGLGLIYANTSDFGLAIANFEEALKIIKKSQNLSMMAFILHNLGLSYNGKSNYPKAKKILQEAITIHESLGDKIGAANSKIAIGLIHNQQGQYQQALSIFIQAEKTVQASQDKILLAAITLNIAQTYRNLSDYNTALRYFNHSLDLFEKTGVKNLVGVTLSERGLVYAALSQYSKAIESFDQALSIHKEVNNRSETAKTLINKGQIYASLGQYQKVLKAAQEALSIAEQVGDKRLTAIALNNIGTSHLLLNDFNAATTRLEQALTLHRANGDQLEESTTLKYHRQSLNIKREIGDRGSEIITLNNIGLVYSAQRQYQLALQQYRSAIILAGQIGSREYLGISLTNEGQALYKLRQLPAAETSLREAVKIWESLRAGLIDQDKVSLGDKVAGTYKILQKVLVEQDKIPEALEISEQARAKALTELLASKVNTISTKDQLKIRQAPNLSKIQQIAQQKNTTFVQYSLIDDRIYVWVIAPTGKINFHQTQLPPNTSIKNLIIAARDSIGADRRNNDNIVLTEENAPTDNDYGSNKPLVTSDFKQLHELLIAPITKYLPQDPNALVTIIPQDQLMIVPFAALQDAQGKYLIDRHTINIAPSIQVLGLTAASKPRTNDSPLVVGNPIYPEMPNGASLKNLPGAEAEAQSIAQILQTQPLLRAAADKKVVIDRMKKANLIHLATHGFPDRIKGELPGAVALTNGFLTSDEIFDMQLQADLVVMSACNTGRGDITGDGVVGLSRSLAAAGAPSMVVSLWAVKDEDTQKLMEEFYFQLWVQKLPKAQAMRQAMLKIKTQPALVSPKSWAGFMLVGEGS